MTTAIYPGTFDPLTNGHIDIACRATKIVDKLIVAIAGDSNKKTWFSLDERIDMAKTIFTDNSKISVCGYHGLLVEFAQKQKVTLIIRSIRNSNDFAFEQQLAGINQLIYPKIDTMLLLTHPNYQAISASFVREITYLHGDVSHLVPSLVQQKLTQRVKELSPKGI